VTTLSTDEELEEVVEYYRSLPYVEYAEPDEIMYALGVPNDPDYRYQWNLTQLQMPRVWDAVTGDPGVVVAVIDTGVAYDLSDYRATSFVSGWDFVNNDADPYDDNGHGTHVSGTVAQSTNNNSGGAGLAYGVSIMPLKVLGGDGSGFTSDIASAVYWAADNGADIINLSLGGGGATTTMRNALSYAYGKGVAIFAASGNEDSPVGYPAAYDDYVMAVGATAYNKQRSYYSNYGTSLDIVAPGGDTSADLNADGQPDGIFQQTITGYDPYTGRTDYTPKHFMFQGTSMASPHVAALGALLRSADPSLTPSEIYTIIRDTAEDLGNSGWDSFYGYGLMNPADAIAAVGGDVPDPDSSDPGQDDPGREEPTDPGDDPDDGTPFPTDPVPGTTSDSITGTMNPLYNTIDTYTVDLSAGEVILELLFSHTGGDLDLYLYDSDGWPVDYSISYTDNESIRYTALYPGTYTIDVQLYQAFQTTPWGSK
jgi:serine protease